jgi:hypothetical protein
MLKRLIIAVLISLMIMAGAFPFELKTTNARDLQMDFRTDPERFVLEDSYLHLYITCSDPSWLSIELLMGQQTILWQEHVEISAQLEKHLQIPVVYPLLEDFEVRILAKSKTSSSTSQSQRKFVIQRKQRGNLTLQGRIMQCSAFQPLGLEGAMIEIISGPSAGKELTEDEGYFTFKQLPAGPYKLRVSHPCASDALEKIVYLDEKSSFQEWCLQTYRIPDMDLWLNKPSGSVFEVGETMTVYLRSSVSMKADLMITDSLETRPLFQGLHLQQDEIQRFFWRPTLSQRLGKVELALVPAEDKLCGQARYQFQLISNMQTGVIGGRVRLGGKAMPGAKVYLPLQSTAPAYTDERGFFEIPDVPAGVHVVRVMSGEDMYADKHGVEVSKGKITEGVEIDLPNENISFVLDPPQISATTHERREKQVPLLISLDEGSINNLQISITEGPAELTVFPNTLPSLLREKRRVWLVIPENCPVGDHSVTVRIGNELHSIEWKGLIQVTGLSRGTFDGSIAPVKKTVIQGEEAVFDFKVEKFTNFNARVSIQAETLPPYSEFQAEEAKEAPASIQFKVRSSLNTPPGQYSVWIKAQGDQLSSWFSCQLEVLKAGGTLASIPESTWNPIVSAGQHVQSTISLWSPKGETRHVRIQLAFGPTWLRFENRNIGTVGETPIEVPIIVQPDNQVVSGAYNYSINLIYGERSEGFFKLEGQIYVQQNELDTPTNLRARYIREKGSITLTWGPPAEAADQVVGYNLYRSLRYPTLEHAVPLNFSLITDRSYVDDDFLVGKSYWYVIRAVRSDGTLSPRSNTAEIRINPSYVFSMRSFFSKGEKAVCFVGEQIRLTLKPSHPAVAEVWIKQNESSVLVLSQDLLGKSVQDLYFLTPDLEGEAVVEVRAVQEDGQEAISQHSINIKKSKAGSLQVNGKLFNSLYQRPVSHARIWVWDGPSRAEGYTDAEGRFVLNGLDEGMYRWMVEYSGTKALSEARYISANSNETMELDLPLLWSPPFFAWQKPGTEQDSFIPGASMELAIFPSIDTQISISVETQGKLRRLVDEKDLSRGIMQAEKMIIPEDIPPGPSYWLIESSQPQGLVRIPFVVQDQKPGWQGQVLDPFGNKLFGVDISDAESDTKIASTNEWGYVALDTPASTLKFNHQGYVPLVLETSDKNPIQVVRLSYAKDDSDKIYQDISVSDDFTEFEWMLSLRSGWIPGVQLSIYSGIKKDSDDETEPEEEIPWKSWPSRDLFPGHCYRLNMDGVPLSADSRLEWKHSDQLHTIPIIKGLAYRWHVESLPQIPIIDAGTEALVELDLYTHGFYRQIVSLEVACEDKDIKAWLLPERFVSGQLLRLMLEIPPHISEGVYLFYLSMKLGDHKDIRPIRIYIRQTRPVEVESITWQPTIYQNQIIEQRFFFENGIEDPQPFPSLPEGVKVQYLPSEVLIQMQSPGPLASFSLPVVKSGNKLAEISIAPQVIEKRKLLVPEITSASEREGIVLQLSPLSTGSYYQVFRSQGYESKTPQHADWRTKEQYLDTSVKERETYHYRALVTDGRLEAAWTDSSTLIYRQLFMVINLKDGHVTNRKQIEFKGSISIGARLYINDKAITLGRNGVYEESYVLKEGPNRFVFRAEDDSGNILEEIRTIYLDTKAPLIELISPDQTTAHTLLNSIQMTVKCEAKAYLSVNGIRLDLDESGTAIFNSPLSYGRNDFQWLATDIAGNQSKLSTWVYRYKAQTLLKLQIANRTAYIGEKAISLDAPPQIVSGRTLVPLRFIAEAMGSKVEWIASSKEIILRLGDKTIKLQVGLKEALINNQDKVILDVPPMIMEGRTMVPLRFVAEVLNSKVDWLPQTKEIHVLVWVWEA